MLYFLLLSAVAYAEFNGYSLYAKYALSLILLLGIFSLIYTKIIKKMTKAKLIYDANYVTEKDKVTFKIDFDCKIPHPFFKALISIYDSKNKLVNSYFYDEKANNIITHTFNELGKYNVVINQIIIKGFFNLFSSKIDLSENRHEIIVYPTISEFELKDLNTFIIRAEGENVNRPGDDYSEIYEIKEYEEGDDIRHIHQTLSTAEKTIIKIGSLQIKEIYIYELKYANRIEDMKKHLREIAYLYKELSKNDEYFLIEYQNNTYEISDIYSYLNFVNEIYEEYKIC